MPILNRRPSEGARAEAYCVSLDISANTERLLPTSGPFWGGLRAAVVAWAVYAPQPLSFPCFVLHFPRFHQRFSLCLLLQSPSTRLFVSLASSLQGVGRSRALRAQPTSVHCTGTDRPTEDGHAHIHTHTSTKKSFKLRARLANR